MRSTCFKKRWPRPTPSLAPGISPGMSAMTKARSPALRAAADLDDAERGREGGERIVGDLRTRGAHHRDEGALADVGEAEEADVGHHLELEQELLHFSGLALLGAARGAIGRRREVEVAAAALAALGDDDALAVRGDVGELLAGRLVFDLGADRQARDEILAAAAVAVGARAVLAAIGGQRPRVGEVEQGAHPAVALEDHVAAAAAVAAGGAAERNELLAAERDRAVAAVTGGDLHARLIDEPHRAALSMVRPADVGRRPCKSWPTSCLPEATAARDSKYDARDVGPDPHRCRTTTRASRRTSATCWRERRELDVEVVLVADGARGLEVAQKGRLFDVAVVDVKLPDARAVSI